MPEGCKLDTTSSTAMLRCGDAYVILSEPVSGDGEGAAEAVLSGAKQNWESAGWAVETARVEELDIDGAEVELTRYKLTQGQEESASLGGVFNTPELAKPRVAVCAPIYGRPFDASRCAELLELLSDHISATRVTGFVLNGESVTFGEECVVREGSVRCGETVLKWMQLDSESATDAPAPEVVANQMRDRGVDVDLESVPCRLAGRARECAVMKLSAESYPDQAVVFMDAQRNGQSVRLTCDIVEPSDPFELPEPCKSVMDLEIDEDPAE
jgi:hypothetical protein